MQDKDRGYVYEIMGAFGIPCTEKKIKECAALLEPIIAKIKWDVEEKYYDDETLRLVTEG